MKQTGLGIIRASLWLVALPLIVGGFAAWQQFSSGSTTQSPIPILSADPAPTRVKPEHPGGAEFPNRDIWIYGVLDGSTGPNPSQASLAPSVEAPALMPSTRSGAVASPSQASPPAVEHILP